MTGTSRTRLVAYTIWKRYRDDDALKNWSMAEQSCECMTTFEAYFDTLKLEHKIELIGRLRRYFMHLATKPEYKDDADTMLGYVCHLLDTDLREQHPEAWIIRSYCVFGDAMIIPPQAWKQSHFLSF